MTERISPHISHPILERLRATTAITSAFALFVTQSTSTVFALPTGGQVVAGQASIITRARTLDVNQTTDRAILDWHGFDIGKDEQVSFSQPSAHSVTLNRVTGSQNPSQILGSLNANGTLFVINPQGVVFGSGAQVNVGSLVASTSDIDNSRFMNGDFTFNITGNPNATVSNAGTIKAGDGGLVMLAGPSVTNSGLIEARLGKVQLASGDTFALDLYGDGLINLQASSALTQQVVNHSGIIDADGGSVLLTAAAAQGAINSLINMDGVIHANSAGGQNGNIRLFAEGSNAVAGNLAAGKGQKQRLSTVLVSGELSASGRGRGKAGGTIEVLGDNIGILQGAMIDASGDTGGGIIRIGGDYHGEGKSPTALHTLLQSGTMLDASAVNSGNGGNVTVWADDWTSFAGDILARGGATSGSGGFVETSGRQTLTAVGNVDASAPNGNSGTWLLDPNNITISTGANANNSGDPNFTTTNNSSVVNTTSIQTDLNNGTNVTITTGSAGTNSQNGDITVANNISKTGGGNASLTLTAKNDIIINTNVAISSNTNKLNVVLNSDSDASGAGAIVMNSGSSIASNGGNITLGGGANPATTAAIGNATNTAGINLNNATLNAAGGNISLIGTGYASAGNKYGIILQAGAKAQTTGSGTITMNGTGGAGTNSNIGIYLTGANTALSSVDGAISLTGTGAGTGTNNYGLYVAAAAAISATGTGTITLTGNGDTSGTSGNRGLYLSGAGTSLASGTGAMMLTGTGGGTTTSNEGIYLDTGAVIAPTGNALIALTGNAGGTTVDGIYLNQSAATDTIKSKGGDVTLLSNQNIRLTNANIMSPGSSAFNVVLNSDRDANSSGRIALTTSNLLSSGGNITLGGGADPTVSNAVGVSGAVEGINLNNATLNAAGGNILLRGTGFATAAANNYGILLQAAAKAQTIGSGTITMNGTGGVGTNSNYGIYLTGASTALSSVNGAISLTGTGGAGTGTNNYGIVAAAAAAISATGSGTITMSGTGGAGTNSNYGLYLTGANTALSSVDGAITLTGTGAGTGTSNYGLYVAAAAAISATGTGTVTLTGIGGTSGTSGNRGLYLSGAGTSLASSTGTLTLNGTGGGTTTSNEGIYLDTGAIIAPTGNAPITLTGNAGGTTAEGIYLNQSAATDTIKSGGGDVTLRTNQTIRLSKANIMSSGGSAFNIVLNADRDANSSGRIALTTSNLLSSGGNITLGGGADPTVSNAVGVSGAVEGINLNASLLTAAGGNISLRGTGFATAAANNYGVILQAASAASTTGSGTITMNGTGGAGTNSNIGIYLTGASTALSSVNGAILLTGTGAGTGTSNYGLYVAAASAVSATGAGTVTLTGIGDTSGTSGNRGIYLSGAGTSLASNTGAMTLTGTGGGTTTTNEGIYLDTGAVIAPTGNAPITLTGNAGGTTVEGVYLNQSAATDTIKSGGGDVTLRSNQTIRLTKTNIMSPTAAAFNIVLNSDRDANSSGRIALTTSNLLSSGGNITLGGGADPTVSNAVGVSGAVEGINLNASLLTAAGGNISLRGTGFATAAANNYGIELQAASAASTTGSGTVTMNGTGGAGTNANYGLFLTGAGTAVSSVNGAISLTGTGAGTGTTNYGANIGTSAAVTSTGSAPITLTARGANGAVDLFDSGAATPIGGVSDTGNITLNADTATWGTMTLNTTGQVLFQPNTASTTIGVAGAAGTLGITSAILNATGAGGITIGNSADSGAMTVNAYTWNAPATLYSGNGGITINGAQTMGNRAFLARTYGSGDITIGASGSVTSSAANNAIVLASGRNFINSKGSAALTASGGRWLVYSTNPANDTIGGLSNSFRRFSCAYGGSCPSFPATGNGLLYSYTPALTITPNALPAIIYGDAVPSLAGYAYAVSGYLGSDSGADAVTGSLTGRTGYTQGSNVGTYNLDYNSGSLASALGYGFSYGNNASAITVGKRTLNGAVQNKTITYGTTTPTLSKSSTSDVAWSNLYGSDTGANLGSVTFTYGGATAGGHNNAGSYTFGVSALTATNYTMGTVTNGTLTINPYTLAVTAAAKSKTYGAADPSLTYIYGSLQNGDTSSVFSGVLSRVAGENVAGGPYAINQNTLSAGSNYTISYTGANLTINPYTLAVAAAAKSKTYGAADPSLTYTYGSLQNGDTSGVFSGALSRVAGENVAGGPYAINQNTLSAGSNYTISYTGANFTINPYTLAVAADAQSKTYGAVDPSLTYTYGSLQNGDTSSVFSGGLSRAVGENVAGGPYAINQNTLSAGSNYTISYTGANLTINPYMLAVAADAKSKTYGAADPSLTYTYGSLQNGDTSGVFSGALNRAAGETVAGGPYAINQNTLSAGSNYTISYTGDNLTINPYMLAVAADAKSKTYGAVDPSLTYTYGSLQNGDTASVFSGALNRAAGENVAGGSYAINQNTLSAGSNYTISYTGDNLTINPYMLAVAADAKSKTYGTADPSLTYTYGSLQNGDTASVFSGALNRAAGENVAGGPYAISQNNLSAGSNYTISYTGDNLTINPYTLAVSADAKSKTYGAADPSLTYTYGSLQNGDTSGVFSGALNRAAGENVAGGPYAINQHTLSAGSNYTISYTPGALTVNKAHLTVTADNQNSTYGGTIPALTDTITGFVGGETLGTSGVNGSASLNTAGTSSSNAGNYAITAALGTLSAANYDFTTFNSGNLSIGQAMLNILADNKTKTYGNPNPALTYGYSGLVNGDTSSVFSGALDTAATSGSKAGIYGITQGSLSGGGNYMVSFTPGTLTISGAGATGTTLTSQINATTQQVYKLNAPVFQPQAGNAPTLIAFDSTLDLLPPSTGQSEGIVAPGSVEIPNYNEKNSTTQTDVDGKTIRFGKEDGVDVNADDDTDKMNISN